MICNTPSAPLSFFMALNSLIYQLGATSMFSRALSTLKSSFGDPKCLFFSFLSLLNFKEKKICQCKLFLLLNLFSLKGIARHVLKISGLLWPVPFGKRTCRRYSGFWWGFFFLGKNPPRKHVSSVPMTGRKIFWVGDKCHEVVTADRPFCWYNSV